MKHTALLGIGCSLNTLFSVWIHGGANSEFVGIIYFISAQLIWSYLELFQSYPKRSTELEYARPFYFIINSFLLTNLLEVDRIRLSYMYSQT